jgi:hypothetical protein
VKYFLIASLVKKLKFVRIVAIFETVKIVKLLKVSFLRGYPVVGLFILCRACS